MRGTLEWCKMWGHRWAHIEVMPDTGCWYLKCERCNRRRDCPEHVDPV